MGQENPLSFLGLLFFFFSYSTSTTTHTSLSFPLLQSESLFQLCSHQVQACCGPWEHTGVSSGTAGMSFHPHPASEQQCPWSSPEAYSWSQQEPNFTKLPGKSPDARPIGHLQEQTVSWSWFLPLPLSPNIWPGQ